MVKITEVTSHLTQGKLDVLCGQCHIPSFVQLVLPDPNQIISHYPPVKIGFYSRFFYYADFCLPLSVFLVDILKHYRINISQLSLFGACKVSQFEVLYRAHNFAPTVALFHVFMLI